MTSSSSGSGRRRPVGRRTGDSGTRDALLDAARDLFAAHGYDGASLRAIAARAGVDAGLIRHFFGSKEMLFATTMADRTVIPERMRAALTGPRDDIARRAADTYLSLWEDEEVRPILLALVRSAMTSAHGAALLIDVIAGRITGAPLSTQDPAAARGLVLAASHLFGVAVARHVLELPPLASMDHDALVAEVAPAIQRYLTGDGAAPSRGADAGAAD